MKKLLLVMFFNVCVLLVGPVYGHAGHDHAHWSADLLHWGFYLSMTLMIGAVMYGLVRLLTDKTSNQKTSKGGRHAA